MERAQRRRIILCLLAFCSLLFVFISFILLLSSTGDKVSSDRYDLAHESPNKPIKDQESSPSIVVTPDIVYKPVSVKTKVFLASIGAILTLFIVGTSFLILKLVRKVEPLPPVDPDPEPEPEPIQPVIIEIYKSSGPWKWLFFACLVCFVGTLMYGYRRQQLARRQSSEDMIRKRLKYLVKTAKKLGLHRVEPITSLEDLTFQGNIALASAFYYAYAANPQLLLWEADGVTYYETELKFGNANGGIDDLTPIEHGKTYVADLDDEGLGHLVDYLDGLQTWFGRLEEAGRLAQQVSAAAENMDPAGYQPSAPWTVKDALIAIAYRPRTGSNRPGSPKIDFTEDDHGGLASLSLDHFPVVVKVAEGRGHGRFLPLDHALHSSIAGWPMANDTLKQFRERYVIVNVRPKDALMYQLQMTLAGAMRYLADLKATMDTLPRMD